MYVYVYTYSIYKYISLCVHVSTYACSSICVYVSIYVRMCIYVSVCVLVLACTCLSPGFGSWNRLVVLYLKSFSMTVIFVNKKQKKKNFNLTLNHYLFSMAVMNNGMRV
jgi:hypothetical protein